MLFLGHLDGENEWKILRCSIHSLLWSTLCPITPAPPFYEWVQYIVASIVIPPISVLAAMPSRAFSGHISNWGFWKVVQREDALCSSSHLAMPVRPSTWDLHQPRKKRWSQWERRKKKRPKAAKVWSQPCTVRPSWMLLWDRVIQERLLEGFGQANIWGNSYSVSWRLLFWDASMC